SVLLSVLGALASVGVAYWGSRQLLRMMQFFPSPIHLDLTPDLRVFGFLLAMAVGTGIAFGILTAWRLLGIEFAPTLRAITRGSGGTRQRINLILVTCQIALSLLLVIGAGLLIRSLHNLHSLDLGFRPENALIFDVQHNPQNPDPAAVA